MNPSWDINDLPKPVLIGIGAGVLALFIILGVFIYNVAFRTAPNAQAMQPGDIVAPPPGYPDRPPFNLKSWQDDQRKAGKLPAAP